MHLTLIPVAGLPGQPETAAAVDGDRLTVDGAEFDLISVPEGGRAWPQGDHPFDGPITRTDGVVACTVRVSYDPETAAPHQPSDPAHWQVEVADGPLPDLIVRRAGAERTLFWPPVAPAQNFTLVIETAEDVAAKAAARRRAAINVERDRRVLAPRVFAIAGYGDVTLTGDARSQVHLLALKDTARDLTGAGVTAAVIPYRDAANVDHELTPAQMAALVRVGKAHITALFHAAMALKETDDADIAADRHWPA
ncbi:hypothetical protein DXV76_18600 [Rhodobacteraceae bacterium CCMM004]|nr:hypothetical protein DXV76_18600 [Rhodobacteraceae bacterium CCMM004]